MQAFSQTGEFQDAAHELNLGTDGGLPQLHKIQTVFWAQRALRSMFLY